MIRAAIAAALLLAILGAAWWGHHAGAASVQAKWDAADKLLAIAQLDAVAARVAQNSVDAKKQAATAATIKGKHDEEMAYVRARIAADRMRRPAFCASAGPASAPGAASSSGGDAADTGGGLVPIETDRDFKALILDVESALAAGRAAQAFIWANGMAPP